MTNQKPGAPEPLTSEEERELRRYVAVGNSAPFEARLLATLDRDRKTAGRSLAEALAAHADPVSADRQRDTRGLQEAALFAYDQIRHHYSDADDFTTIIGQDYGEGPRAIGHTYLGKAASALLAALARSEAALSHPESDTRGLDVERLAQALHHVAYDDWDAATDDPPVMDVGDLSDSGTSDAFSLARQIAAEYNRLSASPDLSIDREGLIAALTTIRDKYGKVCADFEVCVHESCRSSYSAWAVADAAIRGTTQPEPTE